MGVVLMVHQATLANPMGLFGGALCSGAPQMVPALLASSVGWTWFAESLDKTLDHRLLHMSISIVLSNYYVSCEKFEPNNSCSPLWRKQLVKLCDYRVTNTISGVLKN